MRMESENARFLRNGLVAQARKRTPAERLNAFVLHSRRMRSLQALGESRRALTPTPEVPDAE